MTLTFPRNNSEALLITTTFWAGTVAVAWVQWSGRGIAAMWRAGTGVVGAMLLGFLWQLLPGTDLYLLARTADAGRAVCFQRDLVWQPRDHSLGCGEFHSIRWRSGSDSSASRPEVPDLPAADALPDAVRRRY